MTVCELLGPAQEMYFAPRLTTAVLEVLGTNEAIKMRGAQLAQKNISVLDDVLWNNLCQLNCDLYMKLSFEERLACDELEN